MTPPSSARLRRPIAPLLPSLLLLALLIPQRRIVDAAAGGPLAFGGGPPSPPSAAARPRRARGVGRRREARSAVVGFRPRPPAADLNHLGPRPLSSDGGGSTRRAPRAAPPGVPSDGGGRVGNSGGRAGGASRTAGTPERKRKRKEKKKEKEEDPKPSPEPSASASARRPRRRRKRRRSSPLRTSSWNDRLSLLREFHSERGHCDVPPDHPHWPLLRNWMMNQRAAYRRWKRGGGGGGGDEGERGLEEGGGGAEEEEKGGGGVRMTPERAAALDALGFRWSARARWEDRLEQLRDYYSSARAARSGDGGRRDEGRRDDDGPAAEEEEGEASALRRWAERQGAAYRSGRMRADRAEAWEGALAGTRWADDGAPARGRRRRPRRHRRTWDERLEELRAFRAEHGHVRVPPSEAGLYRWIARQQSEHRGGAMNATRASLLEGLGMEWGQPASETWVGRLGELEEFRREHGHVDVPRSVEGLGPWVHAQRSERRRLRRGERSALSPERIEALESLGFRWNLRRRRRRVGP